MNLNYIEQSPVLRTILFILIAFEVCFCHAQGTKYSSSENGGSSLNATRLLRRQAMAERRVYKNKRVLMERINLFLVTFPCAVLFAFVFICYIFIYKQQRLHGWIVLAITGSLFLRFGVIFLIDLPVFYFYWKSSKSLTDLCVTYGVLHHLFFLMCYCWSLVLAFDLWRRVKTVTKLKSGDNEVVHFGFYCSFGFGVPLLNVILAAILEWGVSKSAGVLKPEYGKRCRVGGDQYGYFIGIPTGTLLAVNLVLLGSGVYYIWKAKNASTGGAGAGGGAIQKNLVGLMVKFFVLMGGLSIADIGMHFTGLYDWHPPFQVPIEFVCRVGHACGFVWVFVFGGTAKEQLRKKFPGTFGKIFDALGGRSRTEERSNMATQTSSVANLTVV